jgi:hypothetical protein
VIATWPAIYPARATRTVIFNLREGRSDGFGIGRSAQVNFCSVFSA